MILAAILFDGLGPVGAAMALLVAALIAILAVWLRPLSRRVVVAFGEMWARAQAAKGISLPWREALALLLFAGALAALAGGIAGPRIAERAPRRVAIVLDASASMDARDRDGKRRFDLAKLAATRLARQSNASDEVTILRASASTRSVPAWELAAVDVDDAAIDFAAAAASVSAFLGTEAGTEKRVVVLSDRAASFPDVPGAEVDRLVVGEPGENLAVLSVGISPGNASQGGLDVLVVVGNLGGSDATTTLVLHTDKFRVGATSFAVKAGTTEARAFHLDGLPARELWASLDGITFASGLPDALPRDDRRAAFAPEGGALSVALVTKGNRFLEGALAALGGIAVENGAAAVGGADVAVVDAGSPVPALPARVRGVLRFGVEGGKVVDAPVLSDWNGDHPVTRRVSLDDLTLAKASILSLQPGDVVLAAIDQGPIAIARERNGRREILVGFDPARTDFPLRLGFPVFVGASVRWLAGEGPGALADRGVAGKAIPIAGGGAISRQIVAPWANAAHDGAVSAAAVVTQGGGPALLASQAGLFEIASGDKRLKVEVGVDPEEHALVVQGGAPGEPSLPAWAVETGDAKPGREREITPLLFAAGALLLALKAVFA